MQLQHLLLVYGTLSRLLSNRMSGVAPACDSNCQRQKQLDGLKAALDEATATRIEDPERYQQARIAYYTLLNGQEWLQKEKNRIAKENIEPVLSEYSTKYSVLKEEKDQQQTIAGLASRMLNYQSKDQEELNFLNKNLTDSESEKDVLNRITELGNPSQFMIYFLYAIIGVLALNVLYMLYTKRYVITSYFYTPAPTSIIPPMGGKKQK